MLQLFNRLMNGLADAVLRPWAGASPWPALVVASLLAAVLLVGLFRIASNQPAIRRARNRYIARTLELLLFRHDLRVSLTACWRIFAENVRYLGRFGKPFLVSVVPVFILYVQMAEWFEHRPLRVGETATVEVELHPAFPVMQTAVTLSATNFLHVDSPGVRSSARNTVAWRVRAISPGHGDITTRVADQAETKRLIVGTGLARVSTDRGQPAFFQQLLFPGEPPLPATGRVAGIRVHYPQRELWIGSSRIPWTVAAVGLMMGFGLLLGRVFGVHLA